MEVLHLFILFFFRRSVSGNANNKSSRGSPWTPTFVCMSETTASKTPSSVEKQILYKAGLGVKKIKLDLNDDEQSVINKITADTIRNLEQWHVFDFGLGSVFGG